MSICGYPGLLEAYAANGRTGKALSCPFQAKKSFECAFDPIDRRALRHYRENVEAMSSCDFRSVFHELATGQLGISGTTLFPGFTPAPALGILS